PNDPFILDSLGWALYRMGKLDEAERYLRQALKGGPDAEIAAHLGEVLWRKGERDQARAVWKAQLDSNPDNAVLKETVQRLPPWGGRGGGGAPPVGGLSLSRAAAFRRSGGASLAFALAGGATLQPPESVPATAAASDEPFVIAGRM